MRSLSYLEGFRTVVRRYPERTAVVTADGRSFTYRELDERSDALAAALEARLPGGRCAVFSLNDVAVVESMLAAKKRGRANVQLSTRGAAGELASMSETADARGLIYHAELSETAAKLVERREFDAVIEVGGEGSGDGEGSGSVDGAEAYEEVVARADPAGAPGEPATDPPESAVFFTSGTTSAPKAILVDDEQSWLAANQPALEMSLTASDRALVCSPWYHMVTSQAWLLPHLLVGATVVIQPTFDPEQSLALMEEHDVTGLLAVPTQLETFLRVQDDVGADVDALSYIRTGGAVVPDTLIEKVRARFTEGVFNTYGLTEGVGNLAFAYPEDQLDHPGTIGKASYLWELRVVEAVDPPEKPDPEDEVGPGGTGEIIGKSLQMTGEYIDNPGETEALFVEGAGGPDDRWLRTGDVATVDEDGYLVVIDRVDNMIISGGENVYPEEVQQALKECPGVVDAGVVGLPDEEWGQVVAAAVVTDDDEVTEETLEEHCLDHDSLARFKRPRRYVFVDELPQTATGTLVRGEVVDMFEG